MPTVTANVILVLSDIDKSGIWDFKTNDGVKKLTRVKVLITDKESKNGKNAYIIQQLGKELDSDKQPVLDKDGKEVWKEKFIGSGKKNVYVKKEKTKTDEDKYVAPEQEEDNDLPFILTIPLLIGQAISGFLLMSNLV